MIGFPCDCGHIKKDHEASLIEPEYWQWPRKNLCGECNCIGYIIMSNLKYLAQRYEESIKNGNSR
jgi:hypothetical protein